MLSLEEEIEAVTSSLHWPLRPDPTFSSIAIWNRSCPASMIEFGRELRPTDTGHGVKAHHITWSQHREWTDWDTEGWIEARWLSASDGLDQRKHRSGSLHKYLPIQCFVRFYSPFFCSLSWKRVCCPVDTFTQQKVR